VSARPPDDIVPGEPGLDQFLELLTSGPTADELAGESAAVAMFLASQPAVEAAPEQRTFWLGTVRAAGAGIPGGPDVSGDARRAGRAGGIGRPHRAGRAGRLAAAAVVALAGVFAAAAYAEALPAPVQHVAYRVLGFVGVPDARHAGQAPVHRHPTGTPSKHPSTVPASPHRSATAPASPPSSSPSSSSSPSPRPSASGAAAPPGPGSLTVTVRSGRIVAGTPAVFTGRLTGQGKAMRGAAISLFERTAAQPGWRPAGHGTTGADGGVVLTVSDLTANALFLLTGPDGVRSQPVLVVVVPPVSVSLLNGPHGLGAVLTASSPLAAPGDVVVLQVWSGVSWQSLRARRLDSGDQAAFLVRLRARERVYRVVLRATFEHGRSVSSPVSVPAR
jgi:hypothetical protein